MSSGEKLTASTARELQSHPAIRTDWPSLLVEEWVDTRDTLHMWTQIVGKVRLAKAPMVNHWWQVTLYVSPRGLTTTAIPFDHGYFECELDFLSHELRLETDSGSRRSVALESKPVAAFYEETMAACRDLGIEVEINTKPVEVENAIPFELDQEHATYEPNHVERFWRQLIQADRVFHTFRSRFIGKVSPIQFFWGSFDLAVSRFSGRPAPRHSGGAPNVGAWVMVEGYSHELSSCGFWPGGADEGVFYAYAYPEPDGYAQAEVLPTEAFYHADGGQFVLPYEVVRRAEDPEGTLLAFLQSTYDAAADRAKWDRTALEDNPLRRARPR
jgi:hypothetical protein